MSLFLIQAALIIGLPYGLWRLHMAGIHLSDAAASRNCPCMDPRLRGGDEKKWPGALTGCGKTRHYAPFPHRADA